MKRDPETGTRVYVRDKHGRKVAHECYRFQFTDWQGRRRTGTGFPSRKDTEDRAAEIQREHDEIRRGHREPPKSSKKHGGRTFSDVTDEYLAWGRSQGGREGYPWSKTHAEGRKRQLGWWKERLGLETLGDVDGVLPRAEKELQELQKQEKAGKTLQNYAESLRAFCRWCVQRGYLEDNPLKALAPFDTTPQTRRRAMTPDEIRRLLKVAPEHRRILYEVAFCSGLRANELRNLTAAHLDERRCGVYLDGAWTKNRRPGFQPLPRTLVRRLRAFAESGEVMRLYRKHYSRKETQLSIPEDRLLYVPHHPSDAMDKDLKAAEIPKHLPGEGKLDFHACRVAYISFVLQMGANVKEAQSLARHSTPDLTMNVYGRTRRDRLAGLAEAVGSTILMLESTTTAQPLAAGAESMCSTNTLRGARTGSRTRTPFGTGS